MIKRNTSVTGLSDHLQKYQNTESVIPINQEFLPSRLQTKKTVIVVSTSNLDFSNYQKKINIMKGIIILLQLQIAIQKKKISFSKIKSFSQHDNSQQPNYQDQALIEIQNQSYSQQNMINNYISNDVQKIQNILAIQKSHRRPQNRLNQVTKVFKDKANQTSTRQKSVIYQLICLLNHKFSNHLHQGFKAIQVTKYKQSLINKNYHSAFQRVTSLFDLKKKQYFEQIMKSSLNNLVKVQQDPRGRFLLKLDKWAKKAMLKTMWNWRLVTTQKGINLLQKAANQLVLCTNINKTTAFYRLFHQIKKKRCKISEKRKKALTITSIILNSLINQSRRDCFSKIKLFYGNDDIQRMTKIFLNSQKQILFKKCKQTFNSFMVIEKSIRKTTDPMFFAKIQRSKIVWSFMQMVSNLKDNQRQVLGIWRGLTAESIFKQNQKQYTYNTSLYDQDKSQREYNLKISRQEALLPTSISYAYYEDVDTKKNMFDY